MCICCDVIHLPFVGVLKKTANTRIHINVFRMSTIHLQNNSRTLKKKKTLWVRNRITKSNHNTKIQYSLFCIERQSNRMWILVFELLLDICVLMCKWQKWPFMDYEKLNWKKHLWILWNYKKKIYAKLATWALHLFGSHDITYHTESSSLMWFVKQNINIYKKRRFFFL